MRKDKDLAIGLRKEGKSYSQIREELQISISTLSEWLSPLDWSKNIEKSLREYHKEGSSVRLKNLNKTRGSHLRKIYAEAREEAIYEFENLKYHPLFISGVMLYMGEGDRVSKHNVYVTNVDPRMLKIFKNFLLHVCNCPKSRVRGSILIYPDLIDEECRNYWASKLDMKLENFRKSVIIQGRHKTRRLSYGVCSVGITSRYLSEKMDVWLKLMPDTLLTREYYLKEDDAGIV